MAVVVEGVPRPATPSAARQTVQELAEHLAPSVESLCVTWREASAAAIRAFVDARLARERSILLQIGDTPSERFQPGLFDRRADRLQHLVRQEAADLARHSRPGSRSSSARRRRTPGRRRCCSPSSLSGHARRPRRASRVDGVSRGAAANIESTRGARADCPRLARMAGGARVRARLVGPNDFRCGRRAARRRARIRPAVERAGARWMAILAARRSGPQARRGPAALPPIAAQPRRPWLAIVPKARRRRGRLPCSSRRGARVSTRCGAQPSPKRCGAPPPGVWCSTARGSGSWTPAACTRAASWNSISISRSTMLPPARRCGAAPAPTCSPRRSATPTRCTPSSFASDRHATGVCRSLREGVVAASSDVLGALIACRLPRRRAAVGAARGRIAVPPLARSFEQALTIVYRLLFLLFAEARALVPLWHPVYRDSYSVDALREIAERGGRAPGMWDTLRAMTRLAHAGCEAGDLRVTPFNGRLFSPARTPLAERRDLDDEAARRAVLALSTRTGARSRGARTHHVSRPRRRAAGRGLRNAPRLRAASSTRARRARTRRATGRDARVRIRRAQGHRHVLHAAADRRLPRAAHARPAHAPRARRTDSPASHRRSGDGQRRLPRRGLPLSGARVRTGARARGGLLTRRSRRSGTHRHPPDHRRAMSLRRRPESDGGPARASVAVARHARGRSATQFPRPSAADRRQPAGRLGRGPRTRAAICASAPTVATPRRCSPSTRSRARCARRCRSASRSNRRPTTRSSRCGSRSGRSRR